jgi:Mrp family chromosome partitioning ATPase
MPLLAQGNESRQTVNEIQGGESVGKAHDVEIAPWDPRHVLQPFYETLRDRLITFFDIKNLTHKPKLVAVSGCASGAGVSTVAAGLAASLSETGEGNVLLVDMNIQNGAACQFHRGDLACGLDEVLEIEKRDNALVQDRLYVASESSNSEALPRALPNRFKSLVPRLKASDYDYIIFDMPPVSQISITPRLAKFMDIVLMVVESEKTDRNLVSRASSMLAETNANVGIVLNKGRNYVPRRLQQEL